MNSSGAPYRIIVADGDGARRALVASLCEADPQIIVVGQAGDGDEAARLTIRLRPVLVLMEASLTGPDGEGGIHRIMADAPTPIVVLVHGTSPRDRSAGERAVRGGALRVIPCPQDLRGTTVGDVWAQHLRSMVKALSQVKVVRRRVAIAPQDRPAVLEIVGIAASTGGPAALGQLLRLLPEDFPVPMVVVQHIAEGFLPGLVSWLDGQLPFDVVTAVHGTRLHPGTVCLATDGQHLEVDTRGRAVLTAAPPVAGYRPSATVLFRSLAASFGRAAAGVILTGMGTDGLDGLRELQRAGGRVLAQDESSSVVNGMPGAVVEAGLAHVVGSIADLAADLAAATDRSVS